MNNRNIGALRAGDMRLVLESSLMLMELSDSDEICRCTVRCLKQYFDKETAVVVALRRDGAETLEVKAGAEEGDPAAAFYPDTGGNSLPQVINDPFQGIPSNRSPLLFAWPAEELFSSSLPPVLVDGGNPPPFVYAFPLVSRERNLGAVISMARKELSPAEQEVTVLLAYYAATSIARADDERTREIIEDHHQSIMGGIHDAVMIFDASNRLLFANPAARHMFGFGDPETRDRQPLVRRFSREAIATIERDFEKVRRGKGGYLRRYRGFGQDGKEVWIEGLGDLISYNDSSVVLVVLRDITGRVEAERKLHEVQEKYELVLESIEEGYFETDLAGNPAFCNDVIPRMHRITKDEYFRMTYRDYMTPDSAKMISEEFGELYRTGVPRVSREYEVTAGDGTRMVHELSASLIRDASGKPTGFRGVVRDITEKKLTERALAASEKRYRTILENAGTALIVVEYDIITYANAEFETLSGYSRAEIEGNMTWRDFIHSGSHERLEEEVARYVQDPSIRIRNISVCLVTKSGEPRDVDISISWIRGTRSTLASFSDMTEYKKLEKQIIEAQKLEAVGTLAGGIAHNFNNLLMGIQGNASLVLMDLDSDHPHHARLKKIEEHVRVGAKLTSQLLGFARGGKYETVTTDLAVLVDRVVRMFESTRKDIRIHRKYENNFYRSEVDQGQIEQVVLNILANAGQAMPGGGDITITMKNVDHKGDQASPAGPYVVISIEDSGMGMDTATKEHIFEPFFSTRTLDRGRSGGLGLASAYGIVKNHGGWISVNTAPAQGSVFHVFLPASEKQVSTEYEDDAGPQIFRGTERIMIIDDEQMVLDVGSEILRTLGYQVITAASGDEALEILQRDPGCVDLIMLDMIMPGMSGAAVYEKIRELSLAVKVLLASGRSLEGEAAKMIDHDHVGFIQKPFDVQTLSNAVRELLGGR
jgi:two-component system, cell cycle sensor histidine kinase and response regulator CckA